MKKLNNLYDVHLNVRISSKQSHYLEKLAQTFGKKTSSDAIRLLIDDYILRMEKYERSFGKNENS